MSKSRNASFLFILTLALVISEPTSASRGDANEKVVVVSRKKVVRKKYAPVSSRAFASSSLRYFFNYFCSSFDAR